ncbi:SDR family oxidoreductase [Frankia canadensis]|uniref:SDR family NAD(P)-dependent oxidoreductase n=1 Tax=Frankia canadensis TaxID=1836972 RepID=UPI000C7E1CF6
MAGKVALVTGGSRGIGAAIAARLAADGAAVALTYLRAADQAKEVVDRIGTAGGRGLAIQADGGDRTAPASTVERTVAEFGRLDILVNNAGIFPTGPIRDVTFDEFERTFALHVGAAFFAARSAAAHMGEGGRIVNIGTCLVDRIPAGGLTLYSASKSALVGLTKGLAREFGGRGITVNLVHPGPVDTEMNPADGPRAEGNRALTALGRYGTGEDVAATVAHLVGEGGRWITGAQFAVDGGYTV